MNSRRPDPRSTAPPRTPLVVSALVASALVASSALASGCAREATDSGDPGSSAEADAPAPGSSAEADAPRLRTGSAAYAFTPDGAMERAAIDFAYENRGRDTLYQPACRPNGGSPGLSMAVHRRAQDGWETVWVPMLLACLSEPIEVAPGATYRDTFEIVLHPQDTTFQPELNTEVAIDGTYRLLWQQLLRTYDPNRYPFGEELPESLRVSNAFELGR